MRRKKSIFANDANGEDYLFIFDRKYSFKNPWHSPARTDGPNTATQNGFEYYFTKEFIVTIYDSGRINIEYPSVTLTRIIKYGSSKKAKKYTLKQHIEDRTPPEPEEDTWLDTDDDDIDHK